MGSADNEKALPKVPTERVPEIVAAVIEKTSMPAYRLVIEGDRTPGLTDTKFGGLPYWPLNLDYPTTPKGQKLMLLAQLKMTDFGGDPRLPDHGLLQFFIDAADDCSGMDFDDSTNQTERTLPYTSFWPNRPLREEAHDNASMSIANAVRSYLET